MSSMLRSIDCEEPSPLEPGSGKRMVSEGVLGPGRKKTLRSSSAQPSHGMLAFQIANTMTQREGIAG